MAGERRRRREFGFANKFFEKSTEFRRTIGDCSVGAQAISHRIHKKLLIAFSVVSDVADLVPGTLLRHFGRQFLITLRSKGCVFEKG